MKMTTDGKMGYRKEEQGAEMLSKKKAGMYGMKNYQPTSKVASSGYHQNLNKGVGGTSKKY